MSHKPRANQAVTVIRDPNHPEAGDGGIVPPIETRWKPGQSGNPRGRPSYGAAVIEYINELRDTPEDELERIARDRRCSPTKREAAISILTRLADASDLADFEGLARGEMSLSKLRDSGVPVRRIKKLTERCRTLKDGETLTTREIELSERGDRAIDRILDRTLGKATQTTITANIDARQARAREAMKSLTPEQLQELLEVGRRLGLVEGEA